MRNKGQAEKAFKENRKTILPVCPLLLFPFTTNSRIFREKKERKKSLRE